MPTYLSRIVTIFKTICRAWAAGDLAARLGRGLPARVAASHALDRADASPVVA